MQLIDQGKIFKKVGYRPHSGQKVILQSDARFKVVAAGRRFGKSDVGGHSLLVEAFHAYFRKNELDDLKRRMEYWIVGPNYTDAEKEFRVLWNELTALQVPFDKPGTYNDPIGGNMHISLWGGRFLVHAKSAAHPESLVGEGLHGAIIAEAAKVKERVWTKYVRPTLNDYTGWAQLTSTPEGKNWFYEQWKRGQDPNQEAWASWRRPAWMNPYVYKKPTTDAQVQAVRDLIKQRVPITPRLLNLIGIDPEIGQLMMDLSEPMFKQEIAAEFTEYVGRVFQDFDEEVHVTDLEFNPEWITYGAVDYGFTNPSVWLLIQEDPHGEYIHVLGEVYERGLPPTDFADEIIRRGLAPAGTRAFYPDPASPGDSRILQDRLKIKSRPGTGGPIKNRLEAIRMALKPYIGSDPEKRPRILFDRSCVETIRDMNDYRYPASKEEADKNEAELPMKKDDHAPEALGRYFAGRFGTAPKRTARSTKADMRRARV